MDNDIVKFHDADIPCITDENGNILVAIRPICEAIGLNVHRTMERIKEHPVLMLVHTLRGVPDRRNHTQQMFCLPLDYIPGWLFSIDANRVKASAQTTLLKFQKECFRVLFWHFFPPHAQAMPDLLADRNQKQRFELLGKQKEVEEEKAGILKDFYETEAGLRFVALEKQEKAIKRKLKEVDWEGLNQLGFFDDQLKNDLGDIL
ncbi:hypothetical protein BKI52_02550 [marine bacterium AO1-C]|nr:hypothetical protein BKI52_02550 [marine bacterium AO1-C]